MGLALLVTLVVGVVGIHLAHATPTVETFYVAPAPPGAPSPNPSCTDPTHPCTTINAALSSAGGPTYAGDTMVIDLAHGLYCESMAVGIDVTFEGGWDSAFTTQTINQASPTDVSQNTVISGGGGGVQLQPGWQDGCSNNQILQYRPMFQIGACDPNYVGETAPDSTVIMEDLTVDHFGYEGICNGPPTASRPAGSNLTMNNVTLTQGSSRAFVNQGTATDVANVTISGNDGGGGIANEGGDLKLDHSVISDNATQFGAGIENRALYENGTYSPPGSLTLVESTISGNSGGDGGGIDTHDDSSVTLTDDTFTDNQAGQGAAIDDGGTASYTDGGHMALVNVTIRDNYAGECDPNNPYTPQPPSPSTCPLDVGSGAGEGGGIVIGGTDNTSSATLNNVTISGNNAAQRGGGIYDLDAAAATLTNVAFSGNAANAGGAIYNGRRGSDPGGVLTLTTVAIENNTSSFAGGIYNDAGGQATLTDVTVSNNSAHSAFTTAGGGGIANLGGQLALTNVTIAGNSVTCDTCADSGGAVYGGGLWNAPWSGASTATLNNVTLNGNTANCNGCTVAGGGIDNQASTLNLHGTILANNTVGGSPSNCAEDAVSSQGYNIADDGTCALGATGDLTNNTGLNLGSLADNSGPQTGSASAPETLQTETLGSGSSALDHVPASVCPSTDERGVARPDNGENACDAGAYEYVDTAPPPPAPTKTSVTSSANPSVVGQQVTYTATVAPTSGTGTPTGTVSFSDGTSPISSCSGVSLSAGTATCQATYSGTGSHSITASYGGDGAYSGSDNTASPLTQQVNKANTTTSLGASPSGGVYGQAVTFTATVAVEAPGAGSPTGTVTFTDGSNVLGTGSLSTSNGVTTASYTTSSLAVGSHSITASYGSDGNFNGSGSTSASFVVTQANPTLTVSSASGTLNGTTTLSAQLTGIGGMGLSNEIVSFTLNGNSVGSATTDTGGNASLSNVSLTGVPVGTNVSGVAANFGGDANYTSASASNSLSVTYKFSGFLSPITDTTLSTNPMSVRKAGSTVPVKFQLMDANGAIVQAGSLPLWVTPGNLGPLNSTVDPSTDTDTASTGTTFRWDSTSQQYIYNWQTASTQSGYVWNVCASLDDGSTHCTMIGLK